MSVIENQPVTEAAASKNNSQSTVAASDEADHSSSAPCVTFSKFPELTDEIRISIWKLALPGPCVVPIEVLKKSRESPDKLVLNSGRAVPALLHVCKESAKVARESYSLAFGLPDHDVPAKVYFDYERDIFYLDHWSFRMTGLSVIDPRVPLTPMDYLPQLKEDTLKVKRLALAWKSLWTSRVLDIERTTGRSPGLDLFDHLEADRGRQSKAAYDMMFKVIQHFPNLEELIVILDDEYIDPECNDEVDKTNLTLVKPLPIGRAIAHFEGPCDEPARNRQYIHESNAYSDVVDARWGQDLLEAQMDAKIEAEREGREPRKFPRLTLKSILDSKTAQWLDKAEAEFYKAHGADYFVSDPDEADDDSGEDDAEEDESEEVHSAEHYLEEDESDDPADRSEDLSADIPLHVPRPQAPKDEGYGSDRDRAMPLGADFDFDTFLHAESP